MTFVQGAEYDIGLTVADLDGDGEEDLFGGKSGTTFIAFGEGGGKFQKIDLPNFYHPENARVADLNGDGFKDIVTIGPFYDFENLSDILKVSVYKCLGHGRFDKALVLPVVKYPDGEGGISYPDGVAAGDFDRDGRLDLIAGSWPRRLAIFRGRGDGSFEEKFDFDLPITPNPFGDTPKAVLLHDFDLDGYDDLVVGYRANPTSIYWGLPEGGYDFANPLLLGASLVRRLEVQTGFDWSFVRGDANRDGAVELADAIAMLEQLFLGKPVTCGDASDADDSGSFDLTDPIYLLQHLYLGGPSPPYPYPDANGDYTRDETTWDLGCSFESFKGYSPCPVDAPPETCKWPIRQFIEF